MTRRGFLASFPAIAAAAQGGAAGAFERIDAHLHVHRLAPAISAAFAKRQWRAMTVCVSHAVSAGQTSDVAEVIRNTIAVHRADKRFAWATTFDARGFESPDFAENVVAGLQESFRQGAIAVKIWKNIGMGIRDKAGVWLLPDNPVFDPIFDAIEKANKTLVAHLAEPDGAWLPLDKNNPEIGYYSRNPEWYMYKRPGAPAKDVLLEARDRILERHPKLRVVGCHLGSDEEHWDRLARRLDKYPNFVVDMSARVRYFASGDHEKAREFLMRYQDRLLYATDFTLEPGDDEARAAKQLADRHDWDWNFFTTREMLTSRGRQVTGLGLPESVARKIFRDNAVRWLPGITGA